MSLILNNHKQLLRIALALCLIIPVFDPPYGFYQFLRISMTGGLAYLVYKYDNHKFSKIFMALYIVGIILFQPFEKIIFQKNIWFVIDTIFILILLTDVLIMLKIKNQTKG